MRDSTNIVSEASILAENPFSVHRAEHLGKELYRFFAMPQLFSGRLGSQSLVLVGGRGCGKTMFFIYHTYESKRREHEDPDTGKSRVLEVETVLGVYIHARSDLVTAFDHRDLTTEDWTRLFGHYFNLVAGEQIARIGEDIKRSHSMNSAIESRICKNVSTLLALDPAPKTYGELADSLYQCELETLRYIGNPSRFPEPIVSTPGQLPKLIAEALTSDPLLSSKVFHAFVDEYENLLEYQQKIINTLIKTPSPSFVVDIGLRKEGWKTRSTLAAGESISHPHDFNVFEFDVELTPEQYTDLLRETCRKRLEYFGKVAPPAKQFDSYSIEAYLGEYDLREDVKKMLNGKQRQRLPYKAEIQSVLKQRVRGEQARARLFELLANGRDEIINRLNLCLLLQNKDPEMLAAELKKYNNKEPSRYEQWLHNYDLGVVFLLCRDLKINKRYWGFTTFRLLSSGIIRYFLELCENAFIVASRRGFSFSNPRPLTIEEQDAAAQAVSARKVNEVDSYTPHGMQLKQMVNVLGAVFESLHEDRKVREPEPNHFTTRPEELNENARSVLRSAILWAVLQERRATKRKAPSRVGSEMEYHLNHIYSPFFQISYRRKRSVDIEPGLLNAILADSMPAAKAAGLAILSKKAVRPVDELGAEFDFPGAQSELWVRRFDRSE